MSVGDFLYRLSRRDEQVTALELVFFDFGLGSVASLNVATPLTYTVPRGRALKLNSASLIGTAGGSAGFMAGYIIAVDTSGQSYQLYAKSFFQSAGFIARSADFTSEMIIPAGTVLSATGNFSSGAVVNQFQAGFTGILLPRGNFAV